MTLQADDATKHDVSIYYDTANADYKLTMTEFSPYGLESAPSAEVRWSAPALLPSPTGLKPTAIIYIPLR